ncbi:Gfo/Idh/MocA family protein [Hansschlegelia quercus]|uniref:Gfo/Idh/MocA family oxidoreductase n=1 Tax=Hansschlegelia quercus TaxID=2528245 RepID=A0A4Q9GPV6_9HYPH|nr:Gfo/Idh/MocA family oxidoreductase [Hansschlegelia quercus]TBN55265.1 Gfo/Idh/MocA family oxidoreductase [Hansschlegelia quercus]
MTDETGVSRRGVIAAGGVGLVGATIAGSAAAYTPPSPVDAGAVKSGKVEFPNWRGDADKPSAPPPAPEAPAKRVGFAIVGLGRLALEEILPAFGEAKKARPVALVSGSPDKARVVGEQYGIKPEALYDYASFDRIADNPEIEAVYIVLPNAMHREFVERAAKAGKHVLCEKPMATSSVDARAMTKACADAKVQLMIAYRCQYEPNNRAVQKLVRDGAMGAVKIVEATNTQVMGTGDQWRFRKELAGGGALPDIGLYCLNAARFLTGEEPTEVFARIRNPKDDPRYREVEETIAFTLVFPSGVIANCSSSYGAHENKDLRVHLEKGTIDLERAFAYEGQELKLSRRDGTAESIETKRLGQKNQFALELDHMAECLREGRRPRTPGEEGVQDHVIMEALYESTRSGAPVTLSAVSGLDSTRGPALKSDG